jgi:hypothetical protein
VFEAQASVQDAIAWNDETRAAMTNARRHVIEEKDPQAYVVIKVTR